MLIGNINLVRKQVAVSLISIQEKNVSVSTLSTPKWRTGTKYSDCSIECQFLILLSSFSHVVKVLFEWVDSCVLRISQNQRANSKYLTCLLSMNVIVP